MAVGMTGLVWIGPLFTLEGYGSVSRNLLLGLKRLGLPVRAINRGPDQRHLLEPGVLRELLELTQADAGPAPVVVVHQSPDAYPELRLDGAVRRIGYTIFETDRIPDAWVGPCNAMDEIWVPSAFNRETFVRAGVAPEKVRVFPYGVDTSFFHPVADTFPIPGKKDFCFLYVSFFDYRKGFDLLLEAYLQEFTAADDATLVLKTGVQPGHGLADPVGPDALRQLLLDLVRDRVDLDAPDLPHFVVLAESIDPLRLRALYNTCDLYISTDRANGWGMPCMEAMAMGKPAATIDWSGSTEFMTADNSLLIRPTGRLVPVDERLAGCRPIYAGHRWAEVEVAEVRRVMRQAYEDREGLARIARRGMESVRERYSAIQAARRIRDYLLSGSC